MKVIALLSWYEEPASWLAETVASMAGLVDHLIAVDGPYARFPGAMAKPASGGEQAEIIQRTAAGAGIGCTIHAPRQVWWGGEVEKRDTMFQLGMTIAKPGDDWFLRIDADEVFTQVPADTRKLLSEVEEDAAEIMLWERDPDGKQPLRALFRALPGIHVEQAHYVVTVPSGWETRPKRYLMGNRTLHRVEPCADLLDVRLEHRTNQRPLERRALKADYYRQVHEIERVIPDE